MIEPPPLVRHQGDGGLAAEKGGVRAHRDLRPVVRVGLALDGARQHDAGVVDEDVQGAEYLLYFRDDLLPARLVGDVLALEHAADVLRHRLAGIVVHVGEHHLGPLRCERPRIGLAKTLGAARDQRNLACNTSCHGGDLLNLVGAAILPKSAGYAK